MLQSVSQAESFSVPFGSFQSFPVAAGAEKAYNRSAFSEGVCLDQEAGWVRQIANQDVDAFERLFQSYKRPLWAYISRLVSSRETAEELVNDVLLGVWQGAGRFKGHCQVRTWIFQIARHKALNELRRRRILSEDADQADYLADNSEGPEERLVRKDWVKWALGNLSMEHREVLELTFFHGFSCPEIAEILGCPPATVRTRMHYAKKRLRQLQQEASRRRSQ